MKKQWSEIDDSHFLYIRIESKLEKNVKEKTEKYPFVIKTVHFSFKKNICMPKYLLWETDYPTATSNLILF